MLDEDLALEVIHLVLDADGEQTLRFQRERVSILVEGPHLDALGALDQLVDPRHRETALFDVRNPLRVDDDRLCTST
jgi:hypothetical protein